MSLQQRVYSVLLLSSSESFHRSLEELLPPSRYDPIRRCRSVSEARRQLAEREFDFVLIHAPLPDESPVRLAIDCCRSSSASVLLFTRAEEQEEVYDRVAEHGVFTLPRPLSRATLQRALQWMASARERLRQGERRTDTLEQRMEEIRLVNRAKLLLISERGMSEPEAHRYIEKSAMDHCIPKKEAAERIVRSFSGG